MKTIAAAVMSLLLGFGACIGPAVAQGYKVQPGDTLQIEVLEDPTLNRSVLVAPDGRISLPLAGSLQASGLPVDGIGAAIASQISSNFAAPPHVFVGLAQLAERRPATSAAQPRTISVFVLGEANSPGRLDLAMGTTILQAFAQMGGFTKFAATKRIQLRRSSKTGQETTYQLNYDAIEAGSSAAGRTTLQAGDVIVVPQRKLFE